MDAAADQEQPPSKKPRTSASAASDVPPSNHYEVSYLHRSTVTRAVCSSKHGYVLTASEDGYVKFWKRLSSSSNSGGGATTAAAAGSGGGGPTSSRCLEFVKSYTAHIGPVLALVVSQPEGDTAASVGRDGTIKLYDVGTFDVTGMIKTRNARGGGGADASLASQIELGMHAAFLGEDQSLIAVASASTPSPAAEDESDSDDDGPAPQP